MTDKEAIEILQRMMGKDSVTVEEKEAILTAIGILGWSTLAEGRMKSLKRARDKRNEGD